MKYSFDKCKRSWKIFLVSFWIVWAARMLGRKVGFVWVLRAVEELAKFFLQIYRVVIFLLWCLSWAIAVFRFQPKLFTWKSNKKWIRGQSSATYGSGIFSNWIHHDHKLRSAISPHKKALAHYSGFQFQIMAVLVWEHGTFVCSRRLFKVFIAHEAPYFSLISNFVVAFRPLAF